MSILDSLKLFFSRLNTPKASRDDGALDAANINSRRNFSADFTAAVQMIKSQMDARYPDNYRANFDRNRNSAVDYGAERAEAVDNSSAAIANALRRGATVRQAAEAGAKSVGI